MANEAYPIDISAMPDVSRLAHEVARSGKPLVLRQNGTDLVVVSPARPTPRRRDKTPSPEVIEAALATAGGWKDLVDTESLKADIKRSRGSRRSPVRL
jgi:hypothetical protein